MVLKKHNDICKHTTVHFFFNNLTSAAKKARHDQSVGVCGQLSGDRRGRELDGLLQWFKAHGYLSLGGGKLFHRITPNDFPNSWSEQYPYFPVHRSRDAYANDVIEIFYFLIKNLARLVLYFSKP